MKSKNDYFAVCHLVRFEVISVVVVKKHLKKRDCLISVKALHVPETSVIIYHSTRGNIPEDCIPHHHALYVLQ
jgi:hypothetical protein